MVCTKPSTGKLTSHISFRTKCNYVSTFCFLEHPESFPRVPGPKVPDTKLLTKKLPLGFSSRLLFSKSRFLVLNRCIRSNWSSVVSSSFYTPGILHHVGPYKYPSLTPTPTSHVDHLHRFHQQRLVRTTKYPGDKIRNFFKDTSERSCKSTEDFGTSCKNSTETLY